MSSDIPRPRPKEPFNVRISADLNDEIEAWCAATKTRKVDFAEDALRRNLARVKRQRKTTPKRSV